MFDVLKKLLVLVFAYWRFDRNKYLTQKTNPFYIYIYISFAAPKVRT